MKIAMFVGLVMALLAAPALAQVPGAGVFSAGGSAFEFPIIAAENYNYDEINTIGADVAVAVWGGQAANLRQISKDQANSSPNAVSVNIERLTFGNEVALAAGYGSQASNTVIVSSTQGLVPTV